VKTTIDVKDRGEGERIKTALEHPTTRAMVNVVGSLLPLRNDDIRRRVLAMVKDQLDEDAEAAKLVGSGGHE
jgi:hypothetical protein